MAKIIKIQDNIVSVGTDDGNFFTVNSADLNFKPSVGDEVDVFKNGDTPLVVKKEKVISQNSAVNNLLFPNEEEIISPKSRTASFLLCFFLGGLGIHNFYLGRIGRGVGQLVLCLVGLGAIAFAMLAIGVDISTNGDVDDDLCAALGLIIMPPFIALSIWVLIEWIMILAGSCKDGEGRLVKN